MFDVKCLKYLAVSCLFSLMVTPASVAQRIYKTSEGKKAEVKVCPVDKEYRADLIVYVTQYSHRARGNNGIWFFTDREEHADKSISFVNEWQADVKVFFTDKEHEAGWRNKSRSHYFD